MHSVANSSDLTVVSGGDGAFIVPSLNPGQYQVSAKAEGLATLAAAAVTVTNHQTAQMDLSLARSAPDPGMSPAIAKALEAMQNRIDQLEAELKNRNAQERSADVSAKAGDQQPSRTLLATIAKDPSAIPVLPGTLARPDERTLVASNAPLPSAPQAQPAAQAPAAPAVDTQTPFAYGDFTWLNGNARNKDVALDTKFFTPEVRFDTHFMTDFNQPRDHTMGGATESFRSGEVQVEQISVGGDFHWQNVRGRILYMNGLFATTTPRNDASAGVGQWDVRNAYKYVSEAYGGYHFNVNHGLNVDAGIFVSYIGLFSYYNFDNWTYQPSYRVVQHAVVLQRPANSVVPHQQAEDRALDHQRMAILQPVQRPPWFRRADPVASERVAFDGLQQLRQRHGHAGQSRPRAPAHRR